MEEAAELGNYLPLSFKTPKEQEYIEFLWGSNMGSGRYLLLFFDFFRWCGRGQGMRSEGVNAIFLA